METRVPSHRIAGNTEAKAFPASRTLGLGGQPQPPTEAPSGSHARGAPGPLLPGSGGAPGRAPVFRPSLHEYIRNTVRLILFQMIKFICITTFQPPAS